MVSIMDNGIAQLTLLPRQPSPHSRRNFEIIGVHFRIGFASSLSFSSKHIGFTNRRGICLNQNLPT